MIIQDRTCLLGGDSVPDSFLGGRLSLCQPRRGHRVGTDALLLAASIPTEFQFLVDAGSGVGAVGLAAALKVAHAQISLIDRDPILINYARYNAHLNGVGERVSVMNADLLVPSQRREEGLKEGEACVVLTNPPFWASHNVRISPDLHKAQAHVMTHPETLDAWIKACVSLLSPGGWLVVIHRADHLHSLLASCSTRLGHISLLPLHAHAHQPAIRVILAGKKGSRAPLRILPNWILHDATGRFTSETEDLNRGKTLLSCLWD